MKKPTKGNAPFEAETGSTVPYKRYLMPGQKLPRRHQPKENPPSSHFVRQAEETSRQPEPSETPSPGPVAELQDSIAQLADRYALSPQDIVQLLKDFLLAYEARSALGSPSEALPSKAPALWAQRDLNLRQNPPQFFHAVYDAWLGKGLTRKTLRDLDPDLYRAITVWEVRHPEDRIQDLPTASDLVDQQVERLTSLFTEDELRRLSTVLQARYRRMKQID